MQWESCGTFSHYCCNVQPQAAKEAAVRRGRLHEWDRFEVEGPGEVTPSRYPCGVYTMYLSIVRCLHPGSRTCTTLCSSFGVCGGGSEGHAALAVCAVAKDGAVQM
jgi:hypothetical protein